MGIEFITAKEVRKLLKIGRNTLKNWETDKVLIPINFGERMKRYKYSDVIEFIKKVENDQNDQE
jgi:hypothetical protein